MWTRPKLDLWLTAIVVSFISLHVHAIQENLPDPHADMQSLIEIEYPPEISLHYRERRPDWSPVFSLRSENFSPLKNDVTTNGILLVGLQGGFKYNLDSISLTSEFSYESGSASGKPTFASGESVSLRLAKKTLRFGLLFDSIWPEPYIVPYFQGDVYQMDFLESDIPGVAGLTGSTGIGFGYTAGVLLQLNWLDADQSSRALVQSGLNNTFLDLFIAQSMKPAGAFDFSSKINLGAGIKLEF